MATLWDIAKTLPSGFHDALLHGYRIDFVARTLAFELEVSTGEAYEAAVLTLTRLSFCEVQAPDSRYPFQNPAPLRVNLVECDATHLAVRAAGPSAFAASFFVTSWNAFIHFAAEDAVIEWRAALPRGVST
jgi:hypothetical protein